jgi:phage tail sheath protein FI
MPEYLAPGVFVEETSFRAKSIEGVSTTTTGFVGPTRYGPVYFEPDVITSLVEFERTYGDRQRLAFGENADVIVDNYMWHGARAFFEEGGKRLYVKRIFQMFNEGKPNEDPTQGRAEEKFPTGHGAGSPPAGPTPVGLRVRARYPGAAGAVRVRFTIELGQNVLAKNDLEPNPLLKPQIGGVSPGDVVLITDYTEADLEHSPPVPSSTALHGGSGGLYTAESHFDATLGRRTWRFVPKGAGAVVQQSSLVPTAEPGEVRQRVQVVTLAVAVTANEPGAVAAVWAGLPPDPSHERAGSPDSLFEQFGENREARDKPITIERALDDLGETPVDTGLQVLDLIFYEDSSVKSALTDPAASPAELSVEFLLAGGNDGERPDANHYTGEERPSDNAKTGLVALEDLDDISIVAAPGSTSDYAKRPDVVQATIGALINHATKMKYRIAVVDSGNNQSITDVRSLRAKFDSKYAAFYYPWIRVLDPVTGLSNAMPPSGFVAGIYARNDIERAVFKAPANEVVNLAIGFEKLLNKSQQEVLNPEGINAFRFFEGRGFRLWGARTMSSDPEWKYVNLRRYFAFLEHSIDRGTQWAVFEPNGEQLWANVRRTIEDFLFDQWQNNALLGDKPEKAYFVRCDMSTMTQNDRDNGRLVCLIGVAPLRPAEFVIFRIGQWTGDRKV